MQESIRWKVTRVCVAVFLQSVYITLSDNTISQHKCS